MQTLTAQEAHAQFLKLIELSVQDNLQFRITSPEGTVIMVPEETYDNLMVTLELLSTPGLMESFRQADNAN
jgi:antitoxin YefM